MSIEPLHVKDRCILEDFDQSDPANIGRPLFWQLSNHIIAIESLICSDEVEMAIKMFDLIPAWYREPENYPEELTRLKKLLYQNIYDQFDYAGDADEAGWTLENATAQAGSAYTFPRYEILRDTIGAFNNEGKTPWYFEASPSHGLLPLGLKRDGLKFNFMGKNLNHMALLKLKGWLGEAHWREAPLVDQPTIFGCFESLEHAMRQEDLYESYMKLGIDFDVVLLSVPYACLGNGLSSWKSRRIGHVRGYTTQDFINLAQRFFPGRKWELTKSVSMVLKGVRA